MRASSPDDRAGLAAWSALMSMRVVRVLLLSVLSLTWLAGCETQMKLSDMWKAKDATATSPDVTGSVRTPGDAALSEAGLLGADPNDDLSNGKKLYRAGAYGLAERSFRRAVELHPRDAEAWLGLAASYDRLKRFDLADRAYAQVISIIGPTPEVLNNQGYSYMLRGDLRRARVTLLKARAQAPDNPYVQANLNLLRDSVRKGKAIEAQ